jgi:hypothetical protein
MAHFSYIYVMNNFFPKTSSNFGKNAVFFAKFFGENISQNHIIGPWPSHLPPGLRRIDDLGLDQFQLFAEPHRHHVHVAALFGDGVTRVTSAALLTVSRAAAEAASHIPPTAEEQGCRICLDTIYQNGKKLPNNH